MVDRARLAEYLTELKPGAIRFNRLLTICERVFGEPRIRGSHYIFKTPWRGDPRVNLQKLRGGMSKPYQVRQVTAAIEKMSRSVEGET